MIDLNCSTKATVELLHPYKIIRRREREHEVTDTETTKTVFRIATHVGQNMGTKVKRMK